MLGLLLWSILGYETDEERIEKHNNSISPNYGFETVVETDPKVMRARYELTERIKQGNFDLKPVSELQKRRFIKLKSIVLTPRQPKRKIRFKRLKDIIDDF